MSQARTRRGSQTFGYELTVYDESAARIVVPGETRRVAYIAPRRFKVRYEDVGLPSVVLDVSVGDDRVPWCRSLTVESDSRRGLTTGLLRNLPIHSILGKALRTIEWKVARRDDGTLVDLTGLLARGYEIPAEAPATRIVSDELLEEVARIYRANPTAPTRAVHEGLRLKVSRATAGRYVAEARRRGLLGVATPRRPGEG